MLDCKNLLKKLGLSPGDRIAIDLPPSPDLIALLLAAFELGLCPALLSRHLPKEKLEETLCALDAKFFIDQLPIRATVRKTIYPPLPNRGVLLFTSGSTALPKIAFLTYDQLLANARSAIALFSLTSTDCYLLNLPLYHVAGLGILFRTLLSGARLTTDPADPEISCLSLVPTQLHRGLPAYPRLRFALLGGAPIPPISSQLPLLFSYGLTEVGSLTGLAAPNRPYIPAPGKELRLSAEGEILVRGDSLFSGYWKEGELSLPLTAEGFFATGDLGRKEGEGFLITGRRDWQFISGGENIQPEEIEQELLLIPGVEEAIVIPKSDPEFGARPIAYLVGTPTPAEEIRAHLKEKLPKFKIPLAFFFIDALPKKGGKIDRRQIFLTQKKGLFYNPQA